MRQSNLSALLASLAVHAGLFGWILTHPGPAHQNAAAALSHAPLVVTLLPSEGGNQPAAIPAASLPTPANQPLPPEPENLPDDGRSAGPPAPDSSTEPGRFALPVTYYPARALSKMPQAISRFEPNPPASGDTGIGGKLSIRLWIDASGHLDQVDVVGSDLPPAFEDAALAAFRQMRFAPAEIGGVAVGAQVEVVIEYADLVQQPGQGQSGNQAQPLPASASPTSGNDGRPN